MALSARTAIHPRWTLAPLRALAGFETCVIQIIDPRTDNDDDVDIFTNAPLGGTEILWTGPAQLAVFRQTLNAEIPAGAITQIRSVRFTVPLQDVPFPIRKGLWVRVIECEHDPDAMQYQYTVTSGINSGIAFKRTIEAEADMSVTLGLPTPPVGAGFGLSPFGLTPFGT